MNEINIKLEEKEIKPITKMPIHRILCHNGSYIVTKSFFVYWFYKIYWFFFPPKIKTNNDHLGNILMEVVKKTIENESKKGK